MEQIAAVMAQEGPLLLGLDAPAVTARPSQRRPNHGYVSTRDKHPLSLLGRPVRRSSCDSPRSSRDSPSGV